METNSVKPFKVGERVRLKGYGTVGVESSSIDGRKGTVTGAYPGQLTVRPDGHDWDVGVYPSQCRRLVKKAEPRSVWIKESELIKLFNPVMATPCHADLTVWREKRQGDSPFREFREVRTRSGGASS